MKKLIRFLKDWTLPVSIAVGGACYLLFCCVPQLDALGDRLGEVVDAVFPWMVFSTLFSTFCRIDFHQMRPHRWHIGIIAKRLCAWIVSIPDLSFYLWAAQLSVTSGVTVRNDAEP